MKKIMMAKKGLSEMSRDSAIAGCDDEDLAENYEINQYCRNIYNIVKIDCPLIPLSQW